MFDVSEVDGIQFILNLEALQMIVNACLQSQATHV